jgi:hypothetical protein
VPDVYISSAGDSGRSVGSCWEILVAATQRSSGDVARTITLRPSFPTIDCSRGTNSGAENTIRVREWTSVCAMSASCASKLIGDAT